METILSGLSLPYLIAHGFFNLFFKSGTVLLRQLVDSHLCPESCVGQKPRLIKESGSPPACTAEYFEDYERRLRVKSWFT
jgi:hypothetical protein